MSEIWLAVTLVATFLTVFSVGVFVDMLGRERHRAVSILQAQVGPTTQAIPDLRREQLQRSAFERIVFPSAARVGRAVQRLLPFDMHKRIEQQLVLAGSPRAWTAERVVSLKIVGAVAGLALGVFGVSVLPASAVLRVIVLILCPAIGWLLPSVHVTRMAETRQKGIRRQLADVMDLLTISVEAGLGFDAALAQVAKNVPGALSEEISRLLQEIQIGATRIDAFRHLADRTNVDELQGFVLSLIQADQFGVSISKVLRAQSKELRLKRRQRAEEIAMKIPVKIVFPVIFCILPALFAVVMGPAVIRFIQVFPFGK